MNISFSAPLIFSLGPGAGARVQRTCSVLGEFPYSVIFRIELWPAGAKLMRSQNSFVFLPPLRCDKFD